MWLDDRARVGTVKVRGARANQPALRLAVSGQIESAGLELPAGAPPSAILLIRRFADPLPGRFRVSGPPRPDPTWRRAAVHDLASFYRIASRPRQGSLPADAPAVLFEDRAELLATVASRLALGPSRPAGGGDWWWQALARFLPPEALVSVEAVLTRSPREAPAALAQLFESRQERAVLRCLDGAAVQRVLRAVAEERGLPALARLADDPLLLPPPSPAPATHEPRPGRATQPPAAPQLPAPEPPWREWLPTERAAPLTVEQELLLGIALVLTHAPRQARRDEFRVAAATWRESAAREARPVAPAEAPEALPDEATPTATGAGEERPPARRHSARSQREAPPIAFLDPTNPPARQGRAPSTDAPEAPQPGRRTVGQPHEPSREVAVERSTAPAPEVRPDPTSLELAGEPERRSGAWAQSGLETELGGLFYLVNALVALGLPECFESGWRLASRLGGWGTLELLARGLLARALPADAWSASLADPAWRLLAELDGREPGSLPFLEGAGDADPWRPPEIFELPTSWSHLAAPVPSNRRALDRLQRLGVDPAALRWLRGALPPFERALARATGLRGIRRLAGLLTLRATVFATATHVDLVAGLAGISLAARRGGLDRDPGWVPSLGRIVQIHFR